MDNTKRQRALCTLPKNTIILTMKFVLSYIISSTRRAEPLPAVVPMAAPPPAYEAPPSYDAPSSAPTAAYLHAPAPTTSAPSSYMM
jgi:hypothetical protein